MHPNRTIDRADAAAYLAGLFDGEGHVGYSLDAKGRVTNRRLTICNTDKAILDHAADCLDLLGIEYRVWTRVSTNPRWATRWDVYLCGRRAFVLFARYVKFASPTKRAKLRELLKSYPRPASRYGYWRSGKGYERIAALYDQGYSLTEIARELGIKGHVTVYNALVANEKGRRAYTPVEMANRRWHRDP